MPPVFRTAAVILAVTMVSALPPSPDAEARSGLWAAAQGSSAPAAAAESVPPEEMYGGQRISLDHQNVDIRRILALIGEVSGMNMVVPDSVAGRVTVKLKDVPWDQALDLILASKNLGVEVAGNVLIIDDLPKLRQRGIGLQRRAPLTEGEQVLVARLFTPKYIPAAALGAELSKIKSERGRVVVVGGDVYVEDYPSIVGGQTREFQTLDRD